MQSPDLLNQIMHADRYRLTRQWQRMQAQNPGTTDIADKSPSRSEMERWHQSVQQSALLFQKRDRSVPTLEYDAGLPITAHRDEIIHLLRTRQTIVVCGETGSGKSTQLPKICLDAGFGRAGMIGHTQPRRLAARAVASRLAQELSTQIGSLVGFKVRFSDVTGSDTLVKVMTDGVLLAETQSDRFLEQYDVLIIDEAHERSLNIDFLLAYVKRILSKRPELRLIITSATIDPERFAEHFADENGPAPILEVSGRTYPVEVRYRGQKEEAVDSRGGQAKSPTQQSRGQWSSDDELLLHRSVAEAVDELWAEGSGDILAFFPTERDIRLSSKYLNGHFARKGKYSNVEVLPLYARLSQSDQNKIFAGHSGRRIVLATNVAESSLTVPGIHYVIDSGLVRLSRYASRTKVRRLPVEPISQASANQRSGRCGRLGPGVCIRLYDEEDFNSRPKFTTPEIRRSDLANVLLQCYLLRVGSLDAFPLLDMPAPEAIRDAQRTLRELGAINDRHQLTEIGKQLGQLPCDVRVGRMLLEAHQRNCLAEVIVIAAGLEAPDVRQRPAGQSPQADAAHQRFNDPHSDFLSLIRLWDFYENLRKQLGRSRLQKSLHQHYLSHQGFREWKDLIRQLSQILSHAGMRPGSRRLQLAPVPIPADLEKNNLPRPEGYAAIHQSLLTGLLSGIALRDHQRNEYKAAGGTSIRLWPGSSIFRCPPKWIMAAEIVETSQRFGRTAAGLDAEWIESAAQGLLKHTYHDPYWSEKTGAGLVIQKSILYGLTIVEGRRVPLNSIDPGMARLMMIEHGLIEGKWRCRLPFYQHNLEMLADMEELVRRTRSRRYVVDRYWLMQFYESRIPESVFDLRSLENWAARHRDTKEERALWLRPEDLLEESSEPLDLANAFPNTLRIGATEFPLSYHFEPGSQQDGVTISVPKIALPQMNDDTLGWIVPGLLQDKILAMIRALPKSLRTSFLPAPDVARQLTHRLIEVDRSTSFYQTLADTMADHSGLPITSELLRKLDLPDSVRLRIRVIGDAGEVLAESRDIKKLMNQHAQSIHSVSSIAEAEPRQPVIRPIRSPEDLDGLRDAPTIQRGGFTVAGYWSIVDVGKSVEARVVNTPDEAERLSRFGLMRLFALKNDRLVQSHIKHLPHLNQIAMNLSSLMPAGELQKTLQDLVVRIGMIDGSSLPLNSIDFTARQAAAATRISVAAQEVATWLPQFANNYQQLRLALEKSPQAWEVVVSEIRNQLHELLHKGFLLETPWNWLKEYPRYFQAAKIRLEKLSSGGLPKDRKLAEPLAKARADFREVLQSRNVWDTENLAILDELRWALEEFQVSLFAQQLGTKMTISAKKIAEMLEKVKR